MRAISLDRLRLAVALVLPAILLATALPAPADTPQRASLAGQLLVAAPAMGDPRFRQTVILMVRHDRTGAFGIIVNRPVGEHPLADLLAALGQKDSGAAGRVRIFAGGPVDPERVFVVHSADYDRPDTLKIDGRVALTASLEVLRDLGSNQGPKQSLVAFGYAGWGPGQLEDELAKGAWFTTPQDAKLMFEQDRDKVWDDAMARRTQDL
jgi:putative transcriptional regulator